MNSGLLELLESGDVILADKGFPSIETAIDEEGALLIMPPFKRNNLQFNTYDNEEGYKISSLRIHVERAIQRLKHFDILKFFKQEFVEKADEIVTVICFLCNNMTDLVKPKPT